MSILGLCATAGDATTMLTANTATAKHCCMNLTGYPITRFHLGYHDCPQQISFSMTDSFRGLSVNFTTRSASDMLAKHMRAAIIAANYVRFVHFCPINKATSRVKSSIVPLLEMY